MNECNGDEIVETITEVCGLYFRSVILPKAGMRVGQHVHDYAHANTCGSGAAQFWQDGEHQFDVRAGDVIEIPANKVHEFVATEDNTRLTCVHDCASADSVKSKGV